MAELAGRGLRLCRKTVRRLLRGMGFRRRRLVKSVTKAPSRDRDAQFRRIKWLRGDARRRGDPVISMDSKKKELLGPVFREGTVWSEGPAEVLDHALPSYGDGEVTPHGLYDVRRNVARVHLTGGPDTGQFAVHSLARWWREELRGAYPGAGRLVLLCDCGGSNASTSHRFKRRLWRFCREAGLSVEVAHYPVYCSKYNPIERRVFAHVERSLRGRTFADIGELAGAVGESRTRGAGGLPPLRVDCEVNGETFTVSRSRGGGLDGVPLERHRRLPEYNYRIDPA